MGQSNDEWYGCARNQGLKGNVSDKFEDDLKSFSLSIMDESMLCRGKEYNNSKSIPSKKGRLGFGIVLALRHSQPFA